MADYVRQFGPESVEAEVLYIADFGYFDPLPHRHDLHDGHHSSVVMISPCAAKGLPILLSLARALTEVHFLCVCTAYTASGIASYLRMQQNVTVIDAEADVDVVYGQARIVIQPSLVPESFGLVAAEASLRGIPCVSSDCGGLVEANPMPELIVATDMCFDSYRQVVLLSSAAATESQCLLKGINGMRACQATDTHSLQ